MGQTLCQLEYPGCKTWYNGENWDVFTITACDHCRKIWLKNKEKEKQNTFDFDGEIENEN